MDNNVFSSRNYRLNKLFMRQIGIWPEQSRNTRIILPIVIIAIIGSILVPELIRMHDIWGQIDDIIEGLPPMLIIAAGWTKLINGSIKRTALLELVDRIKCDWISYAKSPKSIEILEKYAVEGRKLTITYAVLFYVAATAFVGLPTIPLVLNVIAPLNESRPKKFMYATEYRVDPERYYYYMLFHSYLTTYTCVIIYITADTMFTVWVQHCCALFEIVGYNLRHAIEKIDTFASKVHCGEDVAYENLRVCIRQHKEAIIFADLIESTYSMSFAGTTGLNMICMSITGVLLVIKLDDTEEALRFAAITLGQVYHLYYNSISGQKIIDHSNRISEYAYESDWSVFSPRSQKLLMLIIARAQKACSLTAGKVYVINMENFSTVVKKSISYFTVLSSLR